MLNFLADSAETQTTALEAHDVAFVTPFMESSNVQLDSVVLWCIIKVLQFICWLFQTHFLQYFMKNIIIQMGMLIKQKDRCDWQIWYDLKLHKKQEYIGLILIHINPLQLTKSQRFQNHKIPKMEKKNTNFHSEKSVLYFSGLLFII